MAFRSMDWGYSLFVYFNMSPGPSAGFHGPSPHGSKHQTGGHMSLLQCLSAGHYRPHNPCSFKSETLRTIVLALAATHSPEELNYVLVDFKGGATFLGCDHLPHTAAVITNLEDEAALVERMYDAISGEMNQIGR